MAEELSEQERRERLARTVEVARAGPDDTSVGEVATAVVAAFGEAVEAVVLRLERSAGTHATVDEVTFARRVRKGVGRALARVVASFASAVLGREVWDEAKWREVGEDPEAVRDASFGITDAAYAAIVHEHVEHLADVWSADLRRQVATIVSSAVLEGGVAEAKRRLRDEVGLDEQRAQVIARTEVLSAWNHATWRTYLRWGHRGDELQWRTAEDERTRPSHAATQGQRVVVGRPFVVGGHDARFPGDPQLPVGERVQCRCGLTLVDARVAAIVASATRAREEQEQREQRVGMAMARLQRETERGEARADLAALRAEVQAEAQRIGDRLGARVALRCPSVQVVDLPSDRIAAYRPAQDGEPEVILVDFVTAVRERGMLRRALAHELAHALVTRTRRVGPGGAVVAGGGPDPDHGDAFLYDATRVARLLRLPAPTAAGAATWPPARRA